MSLPVRAFNRPAALANASNGMLPPDLLVDGRFPARPNARLFYNCARAWWALSALCLAATGYVLTVTSLHDAYRIYSIQLAGFLDRYEPCSFAVYMVTASSKRRKFAYNGNTYWKLKPGRVPSSTPGLSPHGLGCAFDGCVLFSNGSIHSLFSVTVVWNWLIANVVSLGFSWEYTEQGIDDPHLRYFAGDIIPARVLAFEATDPTSPVPVFDPAHGKFGLWPLMVNKPRLGPGATGDGVKYVQGVLNKRGASLNVDGQFGPRTTQAVKDFQTAEHVAADGWIGPVTWPLIDRAATA